MAGPRSVRITANFEANLSSIQAYLTDVDAQQFFELLLDDLFGTVIPNLERFPGMGVDFLRRRCESIETRRGITSLRENWGDCEIREYIFSEYLILYAVTQGTVDLLSIRHHRQLSFDLESNWF